MTNSAHPLHRAVATALLVIASAACTAQTDGLRGSIRAVQDVQGLGSQPVEEGRIAAIPADRVGDVLSGVAARDLEESHRPYLGTPVSSEDVIDAGGAVTEVGDGEFTLDAGPGEYLVCHVVDAADMEVTTGCDLVDLPREGTLEVTTGEAGVRVTVG